jgi:hypothetical protein
VVWRWAMGLDDRGFESRQGLGIFLFTTTSRLALGPTLPPIQWITGAISLEVKRPGRKAGHSHPSSAEVMNEWSYTSTHPILLLDVCSAKAQSLSSDYGLDVFGMDSSK